MNNPLVLVVMGSRSDLDCVQLCLDQLKSLGVPAETRILSAHRTPDAVLELSKTAAERGVEVIIAAAGGAAHLAGVLASSTILPVIGIPIKSSALSGMDSLLSTVQMPAGVPVATMAIGNAGAKNAAIFAAQILALSHPEIKEKVAQFKKEQAERVLRDSVL